MLSLLILTACNLTAPDVNPSPEILITDTSIPDIAPTATASLTPSITPTREIADVPVIVASPLPTEDEPCTCYQRNARSDSGTL